MSHSDSAAADDHSSVLPLESNPDTLNYFLSLLGWDVEQYHFVDVYSTSDETLLNLVPRPVLGILLVMPSSTNTTTNIDTTSRTSTTPTNNRIWHTRQTVGGACGSLAVLHLIANLSEPYSYSSMIKRDTWLDRFLPSLSQETKVWDAELAQLHQTAACYRTNQTSHTHLVRGRRVGTCFVALVPSTNKDHGDDSMVLVELDARKPGPLTHGTTSRETFLEDACQWIEQTVMKSQVDGKFAILALAKNNHDS
jgi:ubiquitin carboxyl-terminal hydrolase L3